MPEWIHNRAEHLLAKNPSMTKSQAFAIATQQSHKLGKSPKGYGTKQGKREARAKYDKPRKEYVKSPNPGGLESPKMASAAQQRKARQMQREKGGVVTRMLRLDDAGSNYLYNRAGRFITTKQASAMREEFEELLAKEALVWGPMLKKQLLGTGIGALGGAAAGAAAGGEEHRLKGALLGGLGGAAVGSAAGYAVPRMRTGMKAGMTGREAAGSVWQDFRANQAANLERLSDKLRPGQSTAAGRRANAASVASAPPPVSRVTGPATAATGAPAAAGAPTRATMSARAAPGAPVAPAGQPTVNVGGAGAQAATAAQPAARRGVRASPALHDQGIKAASAMRQEMAKIALEDTEQAALVGAGLYGGGRLARKPLQREVLRQFSKEVNPEEIAMHGKMVQESPVSIHGVEDISARVPPKMKDMMKRFGANEEQIAASEAAATEKLRGDLANNAAFVQRQGGIRTPGDQDVIVLGKGGFAKKPSILAHEIGHADIHRSRLGRLIQNHPGRLAGLLSHKALPMAGLGAATGFSDNEGVQTAGRWAPAVLAAPMLASEAGASLLGARRLHRGGASRAVMKQVAKDLGGAFGTYALPVGISTGAAHMAQAGVKKGRKFAKGEDLKKESMSQKTYLLDQIPVSPKVRARRADAPEPKHRVKLGAQPLGVYGLPTKGAQQPGFDPGKQLAESQKIGVPKMEQPKVKPLSVKMAQAPSDQQQQAPPPLPPPAMSEPEEGTQSMKMLAEGPTTMSSKMLNAAMMMNMAKSAFRVSQYSGTLGDVHSDIYTPADMKYGGAAGKDSKGKMERAADAALLASGGLVPGYLGYEMGGLPGAAIGAGAGMAASYGAGKLLDRYSKNKKASAMRDELMKLNGMATTPGGKLHQSQQVGQPKVTAPSGPSIAELSKPVGYGTKQPGATKGTI